jgi:type I restriction enzyme S subunit
LLAFGRQHFSNNAQQVVGMASVSQKQLADFPIVLAPLAQQKRIVAEIEKQFSRLDEAVANLKRVKANLKRYKAAVLKAAVEGRLVETEAERARREGRSYETGAQLLQRILETRRSQWQGKGKYKEPAAPDTTDLPELPEGWGWATVESLSMKVADGVHKKPNYLPEGIPFVTVKNLTAGSGISFDDLNYVSTEDHEEFCKRTHPERGDILISKDGTLGVVRLVETDRPFSVFVSVALIKPVDRNMSRYLVTAFESPTVQRQMVPKGSGLQHIHLEDLRADSIPVPPLAEQHRIVAEVDRHLSLLRATEAQVNANLQRAERLRQSILSRAFSGFAS